MAEFKTPTKGNADIDFNDKDTLTPFWFFKRRENDPGVKAFKYLIPPAPVPAPAPASPVHSSLAPMNADIEFYDKITIPPLPFFKRLGYGTGVNVMEFERCALASPVNPSFSRKISKTRVEPSGLRIHRLVNEANLLRRMSHPNIVGFKDFSRGNILYLGIEACDVLLSEMIDKKIEDGSEIFLPQQILKLTIDIAGALDYLHTKMQTLHGDIQPNSILVNGDFVKCKLTDFFVALKLNENGLVERGNLTKSGYSGTETWSPPEVLHDGQVNDKTDIWCLGLTLWQMMAFREPCGYTDDDSDEDDLQLINYEDLRQFFDEFFRTTFGKRQKIPLNVSEEVYIQPLTLYYYCSETTASMRPSANHLAIAARDMLEQCQEDN